MTEGLKTAREQAIAQGKAKFNLGLVSETIEFYESLLAANDQLVSDKNFKARLSVDFARKLIELELYPKALSVLEQAQNELGQIDEHDEA